MSDKEITSVIKSMKLSGKKTSSDKAQSAAFLKKIGILNKTGNVTRAYKDICIPIEQA